MAYTRPTYNSDTVSWVGRPTYSRPAYNSSNVTWYVSTDVAAQLTISVQGQTPTVAYGKTFDPTQRSLTILGQTPTISYGVSLTPTQADIALAGQTPTTHLTTFKRSAVQGNVSTTGEVPTYSIGKVLTPTMRTITVVGQTPVPPINTIIPIFVTGYGFNQTTNIKFTIGEFANVTGGTFTQTPKLFGGAIATGSRFKSQPVLTLSAAQTAYITGSKFDTQPTIRMVSASNAQLEGRGFASVATIVGAAVVVGTGIRSVLTATGVAPERIEVTGNRFNSAISITYEEIATGRVTGRGFFSGLVRSTVTGRGFAQQPIIESLLEVEYSEAFVLNLIPPAEGLYSISRYQHFPFKHLAKIGNEYYGFKDDGLYLLTGDYDIDEVVNGKIVTNDEDLSIYNSKTIAYVYLNGDDDYEVQAVVDHVEQPAFNSGFSGRRVKLSRGSKGRYWYFNVSGIKHLQGIEYRPEGLSRKVK